MTFTLSERALKELSNLKATIRKEVHALLSKQPEPSPVGDRLIRQAKTVSYNHAYPTSGNTFEIELGAPDYDNKTVGQKILDWVKYKKEENWVRIAHSINNIYYPEGTQVHVVLEHNKWYILDGGGVACDFFRFKVVSVGLDDTCEPPLKFATVEPEAYPCGCTTIPGIDEYGLVRVYDTVGCHIFDEIDYEDKKGMAKYMVPVNIECPDEYDPYTEGCKWEIVQLCCGNVMTPVVTEIKYHYDDYDEVPCLRGVRFLTPACPVPTTPNDLCGEEPCPEADCPPPTDYYGL